MTTYKIHPVDDDGWTDWLNPADPWKMRCCDCRLVHDVEFQVRSNKRVRKGEQVTVLIRFRRNERATSASRRK